MKLFMINSMPEALAVTFVLADTSGLVYCFVCFAVQTETILPLLPSFLLLLPLLLLLLLLLVLPLLLLLRLILML